MTLLHDALKYLFDCGAVQSALELGSDWEFAPIEIENFDPHKLAYVNKSGEIATLPIERPTLAATFDSLESFALFVANNAIDDHVDVYIDSQGLRCNLAQKSRYDVARCPLKFSHAFNALRKATPAVFDQKSFLQWLRVELGNLSLAGEAVAHLAESVASIKFHANTEGHSSITASGADVGRSTVAKVSSYKSDEMPDEFVVECAIFDCPEAYKQSIFCHLSIDVMEQRFTVRADPNDLLRAEQEAKAEIGRFVAQQIGDKLRAVYLGKWEGDRNAT